jgi:hypothetical protein
MKRVAILQSNYIPWKGYFDIIASVDEFILYDDMQFTKNDWRNRNKIKTPNGLKWLSIPVGTDINRSIRQVILPENSWRDKHLRAFKFNYGKAPNYDEIMSLLITIYQDKNLKYLSILNRNLIEVICKYLGITTKISNSWDYILSEGKTECLVDICKQAGATIYVTGPSAKGYLDQILFSQAKIGVEWFNYEGYTSYPQLWGQFEHGVSIVDLLFNCGKKSKLKLKFFGNGVS